MECSKDNQKTLSESRAAKLPSPTKLVLLLSRFWSVNAVEEWINGKDGHDDYGRE
jgi:hypothetical protein